MRELISVVTIGYAMSDGDTIRPHDFRSLLSQEHESVQSDADLYEALAEDGQDFWEVIHAPFLARDLNRAQVKEVDSAWAWSRPDRAIASCWTSLASARRTTRSSWTFCRHHRLKP